MPSRCAIWARVSTDEQESGNQLAELRQWAARRGLDVAAEYVIDGPPRGRASHAWIICSRLEQNTDLRMARYKVRDLIGHFVKPRSAGGKMCPHACCRNKRVHPDNMPVILPSKLLRRASDEDLAAHYDRVREFLVGPGMLARPPDKPQTSQPAARARCPGRAGEPRRPAAVHGLI